MNEQKLELNIDSTVLGRSACIKNLYNTVVEGYSQKAMKASMLYGVCVHKFVQVQYETGGHYPSAFKAATELFEKLPVVTPGPKQQHLRDLNHLKTTCFMLWNQWISEDKNYEVLKFNDKPAVELTFDIPYFEDETIKINLKGTIDNWGKIHNGPYCIRDFKTTSAWDNKGYFFQYQRSRQLRIYTLATKMMAELQPDSILGKIGQQKTGAFIDAVFIKPNANDNVYERSEVYMYTDEQMNTFRLLLDDMCKKLSLAVKTGYIPEEGLLNGTCEGKFGPCDYFHVCKSSHDVANLLLGRDFVKKPFNPLKYNE